MEQTCGVSSPSFILYCNLAESHLGWLDGFTQKEQGVRFSSSVSKVFLSVGFIIRVGNHSSRRVVVVIGLKDAAYVLDYGTQTIHKQLKHFHGQPSSICDLNDRSDGDHALSTSIIGYFICDHRLFHLRG
jgi:hypothetical protein